MAKHRLPKYHRARKAVLTVVAAAGISSALVVGQATNSNLLVQLTNTVIGIGGRDDSMSIRVPNKLSGTVVPSSYFYEGINYPASLALSDSARDGLPKLHNAISSRSAETFLIVAGYSEGAMVAELERRRLQALDASAAPSNTQLSFVMIGAPFTPNGGIFGRFPGIPIPVIVDGMGAGVPTRYDTTYVTNEYDPYADFPAYFNPLALLNSLLAVQYSHPDQYYDAIIPGVTPANVTTVHNSAGGYDTYVLVHSQYLPLLGPLRQAAAAVGLTPFSEPVLSAFEPLLRVLVDMSYTDRLNLDPATPTPFSLITPPEKILQALAAIPGAIAEGLANLVNGGGLTIAPVNQNINALSAPPAPAADSGDTALKSLTAAPEAKALPKSEPEAKPEPKPEPKAEDTALKASAESTPTVSTAKSPDDGLHPTVTSNGNKVTPGEGTPSTPASPGTTGTPSTPATTGTTTTTGTSTTTSGTTTGSTPGEASGSTGSEAAA
ncbi:PE-PPE domain-containing protein [Mycobacterium sp. AZCC_0083]|uniref:PE-PPE domain-containing protein n=1 Tax=Mycobacterium sp. AZCC_0083 TaxID=2735882 RepID=UPI00160BEA67|nr:PE-PPE domain-containing protein [Mycobacterium sp. AZCC_0083]MBB5165003.1 hypothetical protein [Mycobacterium sp. AZCC_0083]